MAGGWEGLFGSGSRLKAHRRGRLAFVGAVVHDPCALQPVKASLLPAGCIAAYDGTVEGIPNPMNLPGGECQAIAVDRLDGDRRERRG